MAAQSAGTKMCGMLTDAPSNACGGNPFLSLGHLRFNLRCGVCERESQDSHMGDSKRTSGLDHQKVVVNCSRQRRIEQSWSCSTILLLPFCSS